MRHSSVLFALLMITTFTQVPLSRATERAIVVNSPANDYDVTLTVQLNPETSNADLILTVTQPKPLLRKLSLRAPVEQFSNFSIDSGHLANNDGRTTWEVPSKGGTLKWTASLNVPRGSSWDARITKDWSLLRFEDLLPPLRSTTFKGSSNSFKLLLELPEGWTAETRYGRYTGKALDVFSDTQNFTRPTGWLIAGRLGVRRDEISGRNITIAAPIGTGFPRVPLLAMLNWTLADFVQVFPTTPKRVLIVSGDQTMWRGALSGPDSLYLHLERPIISENGTSTLLHEMVHIATRWFAAPGDDWIVEGIAEYYSLQILHRSGGLSDQRFAASLDSLERWAQEEKAGLRDPSKGPDTAFAVGVFAKIAEEIGTAKLDSVVRHLAGKGRPREISRKALEECIEAFTGKRSAALTAALLLSASNQKNSLKP